jgi:non-homologous end joining protein Ku
LVVPASGKEGTRHGFFVQGARAEKLKEHAVVAKEAEWPPGGNVIDLMEALKRSIEGTAPAKGESACVGKKRA